MFLFVCKAANISYITLLKLPITEIFILNKAAWISQLENTEEGQQYLDSCKPVTDDDIKADIAEFKKILTKGGR